MDHMLLHLEALFTRGGLGRLLSVNEPGGGRAPRLFLGRADEAVRAWFAADVPDHLITELEALCGSAGIPLSGPPSRETLEPLLRCVSRQRWVERVWTGPAYRFPLDLPLEGGSIVVDAENADVLWPYLSEWAVDVEAGATMAAVSRDGRAVSVCCSVRTSGRADEAGVETHPDFRGRGYGAAATLGWARAVRAEGRVPLYSTSWENRASRALADRLGLVQFGADVHLT